METVRKIAWVGLGQMGLPMSGHLAKAGWDVAGYDVAADRRTMAAQSGVRPAESIADAVADADAVFTMLFDAKVLKAVLGEAGGVLESVKPGTLLIDMGTISPNASAEVAQLIAAKGCRYLRAPVSGSATLAESGKISIFVSGEQGDFEAILPVLKDMSISQDYVGPGEAARVVKLAINMLVGSSTSALGEAMRFGAAWDMPRDILIDALISSIVGSRHYQSRAPGLKTGQYGTGGPLNTLLKDVDLVLADAQDKGYDLPIHSYMRTNMAEMIGEGRGNLEASVLAEYLLEDSGKSGAVTAGSDDAADILAADDARYAAMLDGNDGALADLLADGLTYTHTKGVCQTKAEYMASFVSGQFDYQKFDREAAEITLLGDGATMQGTVRIDVLVDGEMRHIHNRYLAVWERGGDRRWRLLSWMGVPANSDAL